MGRLLIIANGNASLRSSYSPKIIPSINDKDLMTQDTRSEYPFEDPFNDQNLEGIIQDRSQPPKST